MGLRIIGAGLGRTGTTSLKLALEHLGIGRFYHMTEVFADARRSLPLWAEVVRGRPDWEAVFAGFTATVDYPGCSYWRELAAFYPEAKVILSLRDAESWFLSVRSTIFAPEALARYASGPFAEFMTGAVIGRFGEHIGDQEFMVDYFARWNAAVIAALPPERLLIHSARDGWEPLCAFLGLAVPRTPYPRVNSREEMQAATQPSAQPGLAEMEGFARDYLARQTAQAFR
ncbi:MAG: hypothetical protein KGK11_00785 [Sphingomonadales bacterium]|nr:hypothetical protein [Sphingomonadales bacterium]